MLHALWLPEITIRQGQVHLSEHQRWYYHDGRGGQNRLVFRKGRFVIRRAGECLEEPSRVGDESEEHTPELQSRLHLVCRLLLETNKIESDTLSLRILLRPV